MLIMIFSSRFDFKLSHATLLLIYFDFLYSQKPAGGVAVLPVKDKKEKDQKPVKEEVLNGKEKLNYKFALKFLI